MDVLNKFIICGLLKNPRTHAMKPAYIQRKSAFGQASHDVMLLAQYFLNMQSPLTCTYCDIIQQFNALLDCNEHDYIFQQDDAQAHTDRKTMTFLCKFFNKC